MAELLAVFYAAQQADKFIAPHAADAVARADGACQARGHDAQHAVPHRMAMLVIDGFEAVKIQVQQRQARAFWCGTHQRMPEHAAEVAAVGQGGQRIVLLPVALQPFAVPGVGQRGARLLQVAVHAGQRVIQRRLRSLMLRQRFVQLLQCFGTFQHPGACQLRHRRQSRQRGHQPGNIAQPLRDGTEEQVPVLLGRCSHAVGATAVGVGGVGNILSGTGHDAAKG